MSIFGCLCLPKEEDHPSADGYDHPGVDLNAVRQENLDGTKPLVDAEIADTNMEESEYKAVEEQVEVPVEGAGEDLVVEEAAVETGFGIAPVSVDIPSEAMDIPLTTDEAAPARSILTDVPAQVVAPTETVEEFIQSLQTATGRPFSKEDRNGTVRERIFFLRDGEGNGQVLTWEEPASQRRLSFRLNRLDREVPMSELISVIEGREESSERHARRPSFANINAAASSSIVTLIFKSRNVTFVAKSDAERDELLRGFQALVSV